MYTIVRRGAAILAACFLFISFAQGSQPDLRRIKVAQKTANQVTKHFGWTPIVQTKDHALYELTMDEVEELAQFLHEERGRCGGFIDVTAGEFDSVPRSAFVMPRKRPVHGFIEDPSSQLLGDLVTAVSEQRIGETVQTLSSLPTRRYDSETGVQASEWLASRLSASGIEVEVVDHRPEKSDWIMPSVIARIRGENPESVIVGGHLDSINHKWFDKKTAPGADDDASGVAAALEAFELLASMPNKPDRTIEFMAYSAEEVGLWGSQSIARRYQNEGRSVRAVMQMDMVMYPEAKNAIFLVTDNVDTNLTNYVAGIAGQTLGLQVGFTECGYACSDHASWTAAGYPSVVPFESSSRKMNPYIHSSKDTMANAPYVDHAAHFARIAVTFLYSLAYEN